MPEPHVSPAEKGSLLCSLFKATTTMEAKNRATRKWLRRENGVEEQERTMRRGLAHTDACNGQGKTILYTCRGKQKKEIMPLGEKSPVWSSLQQRVSVPISLILLYLSHGPICMAVTALRQRYPPSALAWVTAPSRGSLDATNRHPAICISWRERTR